MPAKKKKATAKKAKESDQSKQVKEKVAVKKPGKVNAFPGFLFL